MAEFVCYYEEVVDYKPYIIEAASKADAEEKFLQMTNKSIDFLEVDALVDWELEIEEAD